MKKILLLTFLFTACYTENIFAEGTIGITCETHSASGQLVAFGQTKKGSLGNTIYSDLGFSTNIYPRGYVISTVPRYVALTQGSECLYSPAAIVGGPVVPAAVILDQQWLSNVFGFTAKEFKKVFSCFCSLDANLLEGCTADYEYKSSSLAKGSYITQTGYFISGKCEQDTYGSGYIANWTQYTRESYFEVISCFIAGVKVSTTLGNKDIETLKTKIGLIFTDEIQGIVLSTIHKAKGLESNRVFIIRPDLMPLPNSRSWQYAQELNLIYVAHTRAKTELIFDRVWTDEDGT